MKRILVVDDDDSLRSIIRKTLLASGYEAEAASNGEKALKLLSTETFDLMITDLSMPNMSGLELIEKTVEQYPEMGCLMITAYASVDKAVTAMKLGASDFLTKPFSLAQLEERLKKYFELQELRTENGRLKQTLQKRESLDSLVGKSEALKRTMELVEVVARTSATVLIQGESGTGKELIAKAIHQRSERSEKPFLKINCAAVPETLFESTLFGHEKGAFSGAIKDVEGIFQESNGGTLLLDEISEISLPMQAKLLRVLQEKVVQKVGNTTEVPIDVRIIATSNQNIQEMVKENRFREDLFFRLNVFPITLPRLRDRGEDVILLTKHFVDKHARKHQVNLEGIAPAALEKISSYHWPGNVRELENLLERAVLLSAQSGMVDADVLNLPVPDLNLKEDREALTVGFNLESVEKKLIFEALEATNNHKSNAAALLGISIRTLRNKLNSYRAEHQEEDAC